MKQRIVSGGAVLTLALTMGAGAAYGVSWSSSSSPLNASYNGVAYGSGYGTYANSSGSGLSTAHIRDNVSNGNGIYHNGSVDNYVTIKGTGDACSTAPCWKAAGSWETARTQSASWVSRTNKAVLNPVGITSRLTSRICEDAAFRPDICSSQKVASFNY